MTRKGISIEKKFAMYHFRNRIVKMKNATLIMKLHKLKNYIFLYKKLFYKKMSLKNLKTLKW